MDNTPLRFLALLAVAVCFASASAQAKPKQKPKPKPKPKAASRTAPTKGTAQLPGNAGKLGTKYQLGAKGNELHITLDKAALATRFATKDGLVLATPAQRLVVLHLTIQNPQPKEMSLNGSSFRINTVSPDDQNLESNYRLYHAQRLDSLDMRLKPAQKIQVIAVVPAVATGPINKIMVQRHDANAVLRYDLTGKVQKLANAYATADGIDAAEVGTAAVEAPFEIGPFDVTVEKVETVATPIGSYAPENGKLVVVTIGIKNAAMQPYAMHYSILSPGMVDTNNEPVEFLYAMLRMSSDEALNMKIPPGESVRARLVFRAPLAAEPAKLTLREYDSTRTVAVPLKKPSN